MRRDPDLSLSSAAKLEGIKPETVKKYFFSALAKSNGRFRVRKTDRFVAILYLPDPQGEIVPRRTRSSKERKEANAFLQELARWQRGQPNKLSDWDNREIGGVGLLTEPARIRAMEPALSEFSLYRTFSGGGA